MVHSCDRKVSQVAAMHAASEISNQTADNGAADFVIPNKAGSDQMEMHSWHST